MPLYLPVLKDRAQVALTARGLVAETIPFTSLRDFPTTVATAGNTWAVLVGLRAGDVITGAIAHCQTSAGTGLTLLKMGIASKAGAVLASSASVHATFTTGFNLVPLSAAYTVTADDGYYVCLTAVGTTGPTLTRSSALAASGVVLNSGARPYTSAVATDLVTFTPADATTAFYFALY